MSTALTHKSAAPGIEQSNERLEFLGDAVLSFVAARYLWEALPGAAEGVLSRARTRLVRQETLAEAARALGLEPLLRIGPSEEKLGSRTRDSLLSDAYEALVGALFLDRGEAAASAFIHETLRAALTEVRDTPPEPDPKTRLQMLLQAERRGLPIYRIVSESGQSHAMHFVAEVLAGDEVLGRGEGSSKRAAQAQAAEAALGNLAGANR